jgi:hypothetical protein
MRNRQYKRRQVIPANPKTVRQRRSRGAMGAVSKAWGEVLTEEERLAWNVAGPKVQSRPRLGRGPLTGQMHFTGINSARSAIGREFLRQPPERVVGGPNVVEELTITCEQGRLKLKLRVSGPVAGDIMVLGAAPCRAKWWKCRKPVYLGLLPAPKEGVSDITDMYVARYGEPKAGERVFIRTRQQTNGWEGDDKDVSDLVPVSQGGTAARRRGDSGMLAGANELPGLNGLPELQKDAVAGRRVQGRNPSCPREPHRSSSVGIRLQCRWNRGCARGVGGVGRVWGVCALGDGARNGPWHELWHHS